MDSTIIELSRYTSDDKPYNGEWTNRLAKPITIEDGDYIMLKQAFLDTRQIDNNTILIDKEINWTFRFIYWVQCHSLNQYIMNGQNRTPVELPDGLPYMFVDARPTSDQNANTLRGKPVVESFVVNIPAGTYERPEFAEYVTRQLQGIQTPQNYTFDKNFFSRKITLPTYDLENNFTGFTEYGTLDASSNPITSFIKPVYYGVYNGTGEPGEVYQSMFYKNIYNGQPGYLEYRQGMYYRMTNALNYNYTNNIATQLGNAAVTNTFVYEGTDFYIFDGTMIGASQMAFVYNQDGGNNRFSFQYMHTPLQTAGTGGVSEVVGVCNMASQGNNLSTNRISYLNAYSGIMLVDTTTDGDTTAFLNQLGFTYDNLIPPDVSKVFALNNNCIDSPGTFVTFDYYKSFLPYTTRNKLVTGDLITEKTASLGNYTMIANQSVYCQNPDNTGSSFFMSDSQITDDIVAKDPPISSNTNAGHYLIELNNAHTTTYVNQDKFFSIKGIIGNYFLSGDSFTMSMGPDSLIYQHKGIAMTLSSIKVRILNPVTKGVNDNMGPNSTIYLQITHEEPKPQEDQQK